MAGSIVAGSISAISSVAAATCGVISRGSGSVARRHRRRYQRQRQRRRGSWRLAIVAAAWRRGIGALWRNGGAASAAAGVAYKAYGVISGASGGRSNNHGEAQIIMQHVM